MVMASASALVIIEAIEMVEEMEKVKGYWDDKGLDMHIAVKLNKDGQSIIVVNTKHWIRLHYLYSEKNPSDIWSDLKIIANNIGRSLVKGAYGPYVYIPKLSVKQTQDIFNKIRGQIGKHRIKRKFQFSWNIDDALLEEFC
jgi:hypothetical protein